MAGWIVVGLTVAWVAVAAAFCLWTLTWILRGLRIPYRLVRGMFRDAVKQGAIAVPAAAERPLAFLARLYSPFVFRWLFGPWLIGTLGILIVADWYHIPLAVLIGSR